MEIRSLMKDGRRPLDLISKTEACFMMLLLASLQQTCELCRKPGRVILLQTQRRSNDGRDSGAVQVAWYIITILNH